MVIFDLALRFGVGALKLIVGKNLKALLDKKEVKTIMDAVKLIKRISGRLEKDIGDKCWYRSKRKCVYEEYPLVCWIKVRTLKEGKKLSDITLKDLNECMYRRDK